MYDVEADLLDEVVDLARRGAKVYFARSQSGRPKIKVKHGPFGLLTKRYQPNEATYEAIKAELHRLWEEGQA